MQVRFLEQPSLYQQLWQYGTEKDVTQSVELVKQGAELGEAQAMRDLACIYEHGLGSYSDADDAKADYWNDKAHIAEEK